MNRDLSQYRKVYDKDFLTEDILPDHPLALFDSWFKEADEIDSLEANAMTLSTLEVDGTLKGRIVLLKSFAKEGFTFYTNYNSDKGKAIAANNQVCLSFFWPSSERQVIIQGLAEKVEDATSDTYFATRPRESQLGAHASAQSSVIANREVLEQTLQQLEKEYQDKVIPRPTHWGGYLVKPMRIEFWQGRPSRLHDRIVYTKDTANKSWHSFRVSP